MASLIYIYIFYYKLMWRVKPDDHVLQHDLRMSQRTYCATLEAKTSDFLYKQSHDQYHKMTDYWPRNSVKNNNNNNPCKWKNIYISIFNVISDFWSPQYQRDELAWRVSSDLSELIYNGLKKTGSLLWLLFLWVKILF